jgi:ribose transport system ATP-binding protein
MATLANHIVVLTDHRVRGEIDNDRDYDRVSGRVIRLIRLIHDPADPAAGPKAVRG